MHRKTQNLKPLMSNCFVIALLTMILVAILPLRCYSKSTWQLLFQPRQRIVKSIGIYNEEIFIGTGNGILVSKDKGENWEDFGSSQLRKDANGNSAVNWILVNGEKIYIATSFGAYFSSIESPNWEKFFENKSTETNKINLQKTNEDYTGDFDVDSDNDNEFNSEQINDEDINSIVNEINSLTIDNNFVYLSTNTSLWIYDLKEKSFRRLNEGLEPDILSGNYEIFFSLKNNNDLFLATSNGVYLFDDKNLTWDKISVGIEKLQNGRTNVKHLLIDKEGNLWAACGTGVYKTNDNGKSWKRISDGIRKNDDGFQEALYLFESNETLYVTCASGVYYLDKRNNEWIDFTQGIRSKESNKKVYWISRLQDNFYVATDEGLFITGDSGHSPQISSLLLKGKIESDFANLNEMEPSVIEVQKQALKFSSLPTTGDYKRYRTQARLRNLIPRVGVDLNTTGTSTNYYQLDNGIATDASLNNKFNGDSTKRYQHDGKAFKQFSVLWNTDQLFYDDEIRYILNQARLTANIKENLLDDVTRIYFKRRKLQLESLSNIEIDPLEKIQMSLEIAELTGQLDSRTGGWFSKEVEKRIRSRRKNVV